MHWGPQQKSFSYVLPPDLTCILSQFWGMELIKPIAARGGRWADRKLSARKLVPFSLGVGMLVILTSQEQGVPFRLFSELYRILSSDSKIGSAPWRVLFK